MLLTGSVKPPLFLKIFTDSDNATIFRPRVVAFIGNYEQPVVVRLCKLDIRICRVSHQIIHDLAHWDVHKVNADTWNIAHLFTAGLAVCLVVFCCCGSGFEFHEETIRGVAGDLFTRSLVR